MKLLTMAEAAGLIPGGFTQRALRRALGAHDLPLVVIRGKHFVEPHIIDKLIIQCRVPANPRASSSGPARQDRSGSSETEPDINAQGWVEGIASRLSKHSPPTSPAELLAEMARPRRAR